MKRFRIIPAAVISVLACAFALTSHAQTPSAGSRVDADGAMVRDTTPADHAAATKLFRSTRFTIQLSDWLQPDSLQSVGVDARIDVTRISPDIVRLHYKLQPEKALPAENPFGPNLSALNFVSFCLLEQITLANGRKYYRMGGREGDDTAMGQEFDWYVGLVTKSGARPKGDKGLQWMEADGERPVGSNAEFSRNCDRMLLPGAEQRALDAISRK